MFVLRYVVKQPFRRRVGVWVELWILFEHGQEYDSLWTAINSAHTKSMHCLAVCGSDVITLFWCVAPLALAQCAWIYSNFNCLPQIGWQNSCWVAIVYTVFEARSSNLHLVQPWWWSHCVMLQFVHSHCVSHRVSYARNQYTVQHLSGSHRPWASAKVKSAIHWDPPETARYQTSTWGCQVLHIITANHKAFQR